MVRIVHIRSRIMNKVVYTTHLMTLTVTNRMDFSIPNSKGTTKENKELIEKLCIKYNLHPINDAWLLERLVAKAATLSPPAAV